MTARYKQIRTNLGELQKQLGGLTGTATSSDGFVTATVGPRGQLVKLQLDPRIYRRADSAKLAETITETVQQAGADAAGKVEAVMAKFGPDLDAGSFLRGDLMSQLNRFDFIHDQIAGGAHR
jgi:DNA-binding protein YbaB